MFLSLVSLSEIRNCGITIDFSTSSLRILMIRAPLPTSSQLWPAHLALALKPYNNRKQLGFTEIELRSAVLKYLHYCLE